MFRRGQAVRGIRLPGLFRRGQLIRRVRLPGLFRRGQLIRRFRLPGFFGRAQALGLFGLPDGARLLLRLLGLGQADAARAAAVRSERRTFDRNLDHGRRSGDVEAVRIESQNPYRQCVVPVIARGRDIIESVQFADGQRPGAIPVVGAGTQSATWRHVLDNNLQAAGNTLLLKRCQDVEWNAGAWRVHDLERFCERVRQRGLRSKATRRGIARLSWREGKSYSTPISTPGR